MAVIAGLLGNGGRFERRRKFNLRDRAGQWMSAHCSPRRSSIVWSEIALAGYALASVAILWNTDSWTTVAWRMISAAGRRFVAGLTFGPLGQQRIAGAGRNPSAASDGICASGVRSDRPIGRRS